MVVLVTIVVVCFCCIPTVQVLVCRHKLTLSILTSVLDLVSHLVTWSAYLVVPMETALHLGIGATDRVHTCRRLVIIDRSYVVRLVKGHLYVGLVVTTCHIRDATRLKCHRATRSTLLIWHGRLRE